MTRNMSTACQNYPSVLEPLWASSHPSGTSMLRADRGACRRQRQPSPARHRRASDPGALQAAGPPGAGPCSRCRWRPARPLRIPRGIHNLHLHFNLTGHQACSAAEEGPAAGHGLAANETGGSGRRTGSRAPALQSSGVDHSMTPRGAVCGP